MSKQAEPAKREAGTIITGTIERNMPTEFISDNFTKKTIVIMLKPHDKYPEMVAVDLINEKISEYVSLIEKDAGVTVYGVVNTRAHTNQQTGEEKFYTNVSVVRMARVDVMESATNASKAEQLNDVPF